MRLFPVWMTLIAFTLASDAYGGSRNASGDLSQFANEIASKLIQRSDMNVTVRARNCRLHIEYESLQVAFNLPLKDTTLAESGADDGVILSNSSMTRTLKGGNPEKFERLILRFDRKTVKSVIKSFEKVIAGCGGGRDVAFAD